ncbi:hypothetical protein Hypma_011705 [Hypsizygus marmoreus]|uniref:Uncharacterized protein n=1 Tax=Hypsizygus marmoreus TaxID=39966 RepID=A0A369JJB5_HYPMA|nr:hypothetical protein Hypma_011705 [Hypsizygus marmoreus]
MASPTPVQSFLGGIGLSIPVHTLLLLNGNVFGISGFLHRAIRGGKEALFAVGGIVLGGAFVGLLERGGPKPFGFGLPQILASGFLVGLGSKLSSGCTSGHMICGISRFSLRSIVATSTFFVTGVITANVLHRDLPPIGDMDWTLGPSGKYLLALQAIPLAISLVLAFTAPPIQLATDDKPRPPRTPLRALEFVSSGLEFALALRLSNLTESTRVLSFLLLPFHSAFDPSLAFLAAGALPVSIILYQFYRGSEKPLLGGAWSVPKGGPIDAKLIIGAAIFGVGWGMAGICPGPGLVNFGRALAGGAGIGPAAGWLAAVAVGGLLA